MKKTIAQIQYEMETVKLIKEAMDVDGKTAHKLFEEWTTDAPKVEKDNHSWNTTTESINNLKNPYAEGKSVVESLYKIIDSYNELNKKNK